jgi:heat-inducible transcriptional repressor
MINPMWKPLKKLTQRQRQLFRWIVQRYIGTAVPVGSDHLVKYCKLDCSPATVRNEMVALEEMGFVKQPHTSAGRIPTDLGYRYYIDGLMKHEDMDHEEQFHIHEGIQKAGGDVRNLLEETSRILSEISEELAVVMTPWVSHSIFDRLEFISLSERKVLIVIHLRNRRVKSIIRQLDEDTNEADLTKAASLLNERLSGLMLNKIRNTIHDRFDFALMAGNPMIRLTAESADEWFNFSTPLEIHTAGTKNILTQPEFSDKSLLQGILSFLEDKDGLKGLFESKPQQVDVAIGSENKDDRLRSLSVITAYYQMGREDGVIGVIGPTRMRYSKILPLVDHVARTVSGYFS